MIMKKNRLCFLLTLLLLVIGGSLSAKSLAEGKTEVIADPRLEKMVEHYRKYNAAHPEIPGFRIQILSESGAHSKARDQSAPYRFRQQYPETSVYRSFKSPNYRVRIGDFRTRLEAQRFLIDLSADYPNAFIIADQISFPTND